MARNFSGAATDKITSSSTHSWPTVNTWSAWTYRTGAGGGSLGVIFQKLNTNTRLFNDGSSIFLVADWSTQNGEWFVSLPSNNVWHNIVVTYDAGSTTNDPVFYIDGSSVTVTENVTPTGSYSVTSQSMVIGNNGNSNNRNYGGNIRDVSHYDVILNTNEITSLSKGKCPLKIRYSNILRYYPLFGLHSTEPDFSISRSGGTLTGTALFLPNPPIALQTFFSQNFVEEEILTALNPCISVSDTCFSKNYEVIGY